MTVQEASRAIEAESLTQIWPKAGSKVRRSFIEDRINEIFVGVGGEPEQAAKKVKQRKPRKPKQAPLTQHAYSEINGNTRDS